MSKRQSVFKKYFTNFGLMWPENYVLDSEKVGLPSDNLLNNYFSLIDTKCSENVIHKFLEKNPIILSSHLVGKRKWSFSKPRFGREYIPDFLICTDDSGGYHWLLIELESPNKKVFTKSGQQTAIISHAMKQINEWRIWIRNNISYVRYELDFIDIDAECPAVIVIGRRKDITPNYQELYRELSNRNIKIMSYDGLGFKIR